MEILRGVKLAKQCVCVCVCDFVCVYVYVYIHADAHVYMHERACIHAHSIHIYMHIHTQTGVRGAAASSCGLTVEHVTVLSLSPGYPYDRYAPIIICTDIWWST